MAWGAAARTVQHVPVMSGQGDESEAKRLGGALKVLRHRAGMNQAEAAEQAGFETAEGWRKYETGRATGIFKPDMQRRLAGAVAATVDQLKEEAERIRLTGASLGGGEIVRPSVWSNPRAGEQAFLELRGRVQAGAWLMLDEAAQDAARPLPITRDPRFPHAEQWLSQVDGDSMNRLNILSGDVVHVVDAIGAGYFARTDDIVEVERSRFGGSEREVTLKQVEVTERGVLLWPRSTNPRWQNPLDLRDGAELDETVEVRIRGLVLTATRRF